MNQTLTWDDTTKLQCLHTLFCSSVHLIGIHKMPTVCPYLVSTSYGPEHCHITHSLNICLLNTYCVSGPCSRHRGRVVSATDKNTYPPVVLISASLPGWPGFLPWYSWRNWGLEKLGDCPKASGWQKQTRLQGTDVTWARWRQRDSVKPVSQ